MRALALALLALVLWCVPASAQTFYVGGMLTDSSGSFNTPPVPPGMTKCLLTVDYRSRYRWLRETDFLVNYGNAQCDFVVNGYIAQQATLLSNGAKLTGGRTTLPFGQTGVCVPFDGVYDGAGTSGDTSGYVWKSTGLSALVSVAALGPTITVDADGSSLTGVNIACYGEPPFDVLGTLNWINESWWEADVTVQYLP